MKLTKRVFLFLLISLLLIVLIVFASNPANYTIIGNSVEWNNSYGFISVTPHTIHGIEGCFNVTIKSYMPTQDLDCALIADSNKLQLTSGEYLTTNSGNVTYNYTCPTTNFSYTTNPKWAWCYNINGTMIFNHSFDNGNLSERQVFWNNWEQIDTWNNIPSNRIIKAVYNSRDIYAVTDINFVQSAEKTIRVCGNAISQFTTEKFDVGCKRSGDSWQDVISNGNYIIVDPQWNYTTIPVQGYWKLDESSGDATDSSGNGHTLTNVNTVTYTAGMFGNAANFSENPSSNKALTGGSHTDFNLGTGNFTIAFWIRELGTTGWNIMATQTVNTHGLNVIQYATGGFISLGGYALNEVVGDVVVKNDSWHRVVITREGTGTNLTFIYVDGQLDVGGTYNDDITVSDLRWGGGGVQDANGMSGSLDEIVWIKGTAWNTSEIIRDYLGDVEINNAPNTSDISYDVSTAYNFTNLNCSTATGINDPDGDSMAVFFNVSVDGVQKAEQILTNQPNGSMPSWIIASANYSKGQTIKCNITLYDGSLYSVTNSTSIVISNSVPVIDSYNSSSLNRTLDYINQPNVNFSENETVRFNVNISDQDTSDSHWYSWFVDDTPDTSSTSSWLDRAWNFFSSGLHIVRVVVNDSSNANVTHQWNVNVINVINKFWSVDFVSPPTPADNSNLSSASVNISVQISQSLLEDSEPKEIYHNGSEDFTGTFNFTELNNTDKSIQLSYANLTGTYTSNVSDAGKNTVWTSLKWSSFLPTNGELGSGASMVGLWHMNEAYWNGATGEVVDSSGNNNHGTSSGASTVSDGRFYRAGSFDGVDDYVSIPSTLGDELDIISDMTIMAWIKWKGSSNPPSFYYPRIIEKDYVTSYMFSLMPDDATRLSVWLQNSEIASTATGSLSMNEWHHVGFTFNDSSNAVKIYIDGIEKGSGSFTGALSGNASNVYIGRYPRGAVAYFNGTIDDMAVWNRSLAPEEIQDIYNSTVSDIRFQARSCDDSSCSGESFVGPSGSSDYYINEAAESLSNLPSNRYFQYKTYFETDSAALTPKLFNVTVLGDTVAVYSTANTSSVWIDFNGANITMGGSNSLYSYVNNSLNPGTYNYLVYSNDSYGNINFTEKRMFNVPSYNITFNVVSGEDESSIDFIDSIACDYSEFSKGVDNSNPYGPYNFPVGTWTCTFIEEKYWNKTQSFIADSPKTVNVAMSWHGGLSYEEHTQLDWLYNCWKYGECDAYTKLSGIYENVSRIWNEYLPTNTSVVTTESIISNVLSATNNISINYTLNVPYKRGIENQRLLPIRIFYWFTDISGKCYNQDQQNDTNRAESPYCIPLIAEYLGPNNGTTSFKVDLRPNLPAGNYTIVRSIDIDPPINNQVLWINYGREVVGSIMVDNPVETELELGLQPSTVDAKSPVLPNIWSNKITGATITFPESVKIKSIGWFIILGLTIICTTITIISRMYIRSRYK